MIASSLLLLSSSLSHLCTVSFFLKDLINLFVERGEGREKERKRNINVWWPLACLLPGTWPATQACAQTGNPTGDPLVHRPVLNPLSYTSWGQYLAFNRKAANVSWSRMLFTIDFYRYFVRLFLVCQEFLPQRV